MHRITERHFYQYVNCPSWIFRDAHMEERDVSALDLILQKNGLLPDVKKEALRERGFEEVEIEDHDEAFLKTVELMEQGVQTILHGALIHGRYIARPDVLERVEGRSTFGDYYYVAADMKRSARIRNDAMLAGAFYADVLFMIQGAKPQQGYIITTDLTVVPYILSEVEGQYHLTLHHIERILAGEEPSKFLTSRCKQSPWFHACVSEADECDSLSRINRIWKEEMDRIVESGTKTVTAFSKLSEKKLLEIDGVSEDRLHWLQRRAKALVSGEVEIIEPIDFIETAKELHFDIEADPLRDVDYLFGVLEVSVDKRGTKRKKYHSFLAKTPSEEQQAWEAFVEFVARRPDAPIYHYGWYEVDVCRKMAAKYNTPEAKTEHLFANMIDLLALIRPAVIFPLSFYSLKDLAKFVGFSWRHPEASGVNSILWYEDWLAYDDEKKLQDVVEYNEDDVRATYALKEWLMENAH